MKTWDLPDPEWLEPPTEEDAPEIVCGSCGESGFPSYITLSYNRETQERTMIGCPECTVFVTDDALPLECDFCGYKTNPEYECTFAIAGGLCLCENCFIKAEPGDESYSDYEYRED